MREGIEAQQAKARKALTLGSQTPRAEGHAGNMETIIFKTSLCGYNI